MATWPDLEDTDPSKSSSPSHQLSPVATADHKMMDALGPSSDTDKSTTAQGGLSTDVKSVVLNIQWRKFAEGLWPVGKQCGVDEINNGEAGRQCGVDEMNIWVAGRHSVNY